MKLRELAKENQELLRDGIINIIIWKEGRSWKATELYSWDDDTKDPDDVKLEAEIRAKDPKAIIVDGYNSFAAYSLDYIEFQIKRLYEKEPVQEEVEVAAEAAAQEEVKPVKLYRSDEGFYDLIKEARAGKIIDSDYSRGLSEYVATISQANRFVYTVVENIDNGTYYSVEKAPGLAFTMMLEEKDELINGEALKTIEQYRPDDGGPGYDVIVVKAPSLAAVTRETDDGIVYRACEVQDNFISCWKPVNEGPAEYHIEY